MDFYVPRKNGAPVHEGCSGFDIKDSRGRKHRYYPDRNGRVQVENPDHIKAIENAAKADGGWVHKATGVASPKTPSKHCKPCRFSAYKWQTNCPKCGEPLTLPGEDQ